MTTREIIIETTRQLCNEGRASNVTTKHIADAINISAGNLYYHFKNKEEIIREIYLQYFAKSDKLWREPDFWASEDGIINFLAGLNVLMNEYLFCFRDVSYLLSRDSELKKIYVARFLRHSEFLDQTFYAWESNGIMRPFSSDEERKNAAHNLNLISQAWITCYDMLHDEITPELIYEGINQHLSLMAPYVYPEIFNRIKVRIRESIQPVARLSRQGA